MLNILATIIPFLGLVRFIYGRFPYGTTYESEQGNPFLYIPDFSNKMRQCILNFGIATVNRGVLFGDYLDWWLPVVTCIFCDTYM